MNVLLLVNAVALAVCIVLLVVTLIAWICAERKITKLGGKSWLFKDETDDD